MNTVELIDFIAKSKQVENVSALPLDYEFFTKNIQNITYMLSCKGIVMFSENTAAITFYGYTNIRFVVKHKGNYVLNDFKFKDIEFRIIGKGLDKKEKGIFRVLDDIGKNILLILFILLAYTSMFNFYFDTNYEGLSKINDALINVINIFIAAFFVFIGFFYSDKQKNINTYKKGLFDKFMRTDIYVLKVSLSALILRLISNSLIYFKCSNIIVTKFVKTYIINSKEYNIIKFTVAEVLTFIAIVSIIICFDSIINYYIKKIRSNYFIDAFEEIIRDNKKNGE